MAFELMRLSQRTWRRLDAPHLLPKVRAGVAFVDGIAESSTPPNTQAPVRSDRRRKKRSFRQLRDAA